MIPIPSDPEQDRIGEIGLLPQHYPASAILPLQQRGLQTQSLYEMASRPGFPHANRPPPPAASVSSTHVNNILQNYSNEQVVCALMTQLREKEAQLTALSEQQRTGAEKDARIAQLENNFNRAVAERDTRIAQLERKLAERGEDSAAASLEIAEAGLKQLADAHTEAKRAIKNRDEQLALLRPMVKKLEARVEEYERGPQVVAQLEEELDSVKLELATAKQENLEELDTVRGELAAARDSVEELEKKLKGKEWMIKSLKDESHEQRGQENHLRAHIKKLDEKIDVYEKKFEGRGRDVPMLVAKLKDYEVRVKDLQRQLRRLTNKKLNELVLKSKPERPPAETAKGRATPPTDTEDDSDTRVSAASSSLVSLYEDEEEDLTIASTVVASVGSDDDMEPFYARAGRDEDVIGDFFAGVESLQSEGLCCAQQHEPGEGLCCAQPGLREPQEDGGRLGGVSPRFRDAKDRSDRARERRSGRRGVR